MKWRNCLGRNRKDRMLGGQSVNTAFIPLLYQIQVKYIFPNFTLLSLWGLSYVIIHFRATDPKPNLNNNSMLILNTLTQPVGVVRTNQKCPHFPTKGPFWQNCVFYVLIQCPLYSVRTTDIHQALDRSISLINQECLTFFFKGWQSLERIAIGTWTVECHQLSAAFKC